MHRLVKSKLAWIALVYVCILVVALVFAINAGHYECTLDDIWNSPKVFPDVWNAAKSKEPTDEIKLFLHFDQKPSEEEMQQLEHNGFTVFNWSWTSPIGDITTGFYMGECKVNDICKLDDLEFVVKITSGEGGTRTQ